MRLAYLSYLDTIAEEADRLEDASTHGLGKRVPTCPEWTLGELITHVASEYRFWGTQVRAADPEMPHETSIPTAPADLLVEADQLLNSLRGAGPDAPCWNFTGDELTTGWVARRLALQSSVHRVDAQLTWGRPLGLDIELAIDGIEERLAVDLAKRLEDDEQASLGGSICLICSDAPAAWVVEVEDGQLRWRHGRGPASAALVGSASQVFLFTWNRLDPYVLSVTGDRAIADAWSKLPG